MQPGSFTGVRSQNAGTTGVGHYGKIMARGQGLFGNQAPVFHGHGAAAWACAGVICPWTIWKMYGDTRMIEETYDAMARYLEACGKDGPGGRKAHTWGDWLAPGARPPTNGDRQPANGSVICKAETQLPVSARYARSPQFATPRLSTSCSRLSTSRETDGTRSSGLARWAKITPRTSRER